MSSPSSPDHKKKHEHKKKSTSLPPDMLPDGGLNSRIHGVPGSTPGCTAGAYAKTLDPENLPEISLKTCFPDHYALAKKWLGDVRPKSLQLLLTAFGPQPTVADIVNKWLIRRVGRKCIEGTEEGRKDMEAFCVDVIKRLRKLPTCSEKLYRAVPWSAMGKSAPGLSEFEEETNIVWPIFASLTKSESRSRDMLKTEGGILFVVTTDQARDVTDIASVHQDDGEFMLEPNSVFTITGNKQEDKIFVVEMKQNMPSMRPIMKEIEEHKHHHHEAKRSASADPADSSLMIPVSPVSTKPERSATIVTPVMRRVPSMSATPITRKNSLTVLTEPNSSSQPGSPRFARSSSRLAIGQSPRGPMRVLSKPAHRVQPGNLSNTMTMWSAARGYIKILSCNSRGSNHIVKSYTPSWASGEHKDIKKGEKDEEKKKSHEKEEEKEKKEKKEKKEEKEKEKEKGKEKEETKEEKEGKKDKKDKKKDKKKKKEKEKGSDSESSKASGTEGTEKKTVSDDSKPSPPVSPTTAGYGTMELYPNQAPTYIIDDRTVDWQTIGGIVLNSTREAPVIFMSLK